MGGSERSFLDLIENAETSARKNFLIVAPAAGPLFDEVKKRTPEISCRVVPFPTLFSRGTRKLPLMTLFWTLLSIPQLLIYFIRLFKVYKDFKPDLVYSNGIKCHLLSLVMKKLTKIPLVWHMQDYFPGFGFVKTYLNLISTRPDLIICNSNSVNEDLKSKVGSSWSRLNTTVFNAVNPEQFSYSSKPEKSPVTISMVGMITPWKGQDVFIDGIAWLKKNHPQLQFQAQIVGGEAYATAGETGFKDHLIQKVKNLNLTDCVHFLGMISNIEKIYQTSDIVTHCSKKPEPFGRVIIEAMASGCSVIATNAGGAAEIVNHNQNGLLVTPGSGEELGKALYRLMADYSLRSQLAAQGRKDVEQIFSSAHFAKTIFSQIESLPV